jgi:hypothetical protein
VRPLCQPWENRAKTGTFETRSQRKLGKEILPKANVEELAQVLFKAIDQHEETHEDLTDEMISAACELVCDGG